MSRGTSRPQFRARKSGYSREIEKREIIQRFLIICEGEKTEPNYFRSFRVPALVVDVEGTGENTTSLVRRADELRGRGDYDQVWCVFDRDSFPAQNFNAALQMAAAKGIRVAYSNEAFELWYLLHFNYCDTALSRDQYGGKLRTLLGRPYLKNDSTMFEALYTRLDAALRNARHLRNSYDPHTPCDDNPCTTVFELVEQLRRFAN